VSTRSATVPMSLTEAISAFVAYKRALNRGYVTEEKALQLMGRWLAVQHVSSLAAVTRPMIDAFLRSRSHRRPRSYNHLLGVARRFFDWAVLQEYLQQNPVLTDARRRGSARRPYLFSTEEVRRLLALARALPDRPRGQHRALVYETAFALLFALGLRVGEVSRLRLGDVDLERDVLTIRESKFYKSRLVPFGPRIAQRLRQHIEQRLADSRVPDTPLFSFTRRGCVCPEAISMTFHALWPQLGLTIPAGVSPPRLHDLRHSFAVATLLRWYREGIDPNQRLLQLSTFMGHVDPTSTAVYLTITEQLLAQAEARFRSHALSRIGMGEVS
jgi:site-specific recombinase XerD